MNVVRYFAFGFVILSVALLSVGQAQGSTWTADSPLSTSRDQFAGDVLGGKIYVFGGNGDPDGINLKSTEMFDPATGLWTYKANNEHNNGQGVEEITGAVMNDKLYVFGAWGGGTPYGVFNFVEEYNPVADTWTSKAPMPTTRASATAVVYNGEIYLFGGYYSNEGGSEATYTVVEAYNPSTDTWRSVTNLPKVLDGAAITVVDRKAYVIGGYSPSEGQLVNDVIAYDFQTGEWRTDGLAPLPTPRVFSYGSAAPVVGGKIYLVGGIVGTETSNWTTDVVEIYDPVSNTWSTGPSLPTPSEGHLSVVVDDTVYVIGGKEHQAGEDTETRTGAVWKLDLSVDNGYLVTNDLWIRAVINTVEKGPIEAVWQKGGEDTTAANDRVIWGHFYASPDDVTWGSADNPDIYVKIWFDHGGRLDVNFFHVSVPDIEVSSDYPYDATWDEQGTTTMHTRYIRQYYEDGQSYSD